MDGERKHNSISIICTRNTVDGVYPPLILALQAVRLGARASIFFTFDGVEIIKKGGLDSVKYYPHGIIGVIPGMPALATHMMYKLAQERANVPPPGDILEMSVLEGVKLYACKMTMDMAGIKREELFDGVEVIDAQGYMKMALNTDINMFT